MCPAAGVPRSACRIIPAGDSPKKPKVCMEYPKSFLMVLAGCGLALASAAAAAEEPPTQVWVNAGLLSYHIDRGKNYNETNLGAGVEVLLAPNHGIMAGTYKNSDYRHSRYFGYEWRPLHWQPGGVQVSAGVVASAIDGYPATNNGGWFLA